MARDYYADAHEIAERLAEAGEYAWSDRIEQVIAAGFTATEILMGIQVQLGLLLDSDATLSAGTRELIIDLRRSIQQAVE